MNKRQELHCNGLDACVFFAEGIPNSIVNNGWVLDIAYNGIQLAVLAADQVAAQNLIPVLTRNLCVTHGLDLPPFLDDQDWAKQLLPVA